MTALTGIIAFFSSALGRYLLIAIVAGGFLIGIRQQGYNAAHRKCVAAAKEREIEIARRDVTISELKAKESDRLAAEQLKTEETDNAVQRKLEEELAKRKPADRCDLSKSDAKRLR
jgi:hypothetical protein